MIDYSPCECHSLESAQAALSTAPSESITFLVYDKKVLSEIPKGSMVRFNIESKNTQTWNWDEASRKYEEEVYFSATNVSVALSTSG